MLTSYHLTTKNDFDRISVVAKVTQISETAKLSCNITKQNVTITDSTGAVKLIDTVGGQRWSSDRIPLTKHNGPVIPKM